MNATSVNRKRYTFLSAYTDRCGTVESFGERLVMLKRSSGQR